MSVLTHDAQFLHKCLEMSMEGEIEKRSSLMDQNCIYKKTSRIARLPRYLTIQFVRFFWKAGQDGKPGTKSKITRPVEFPLQLDMLDFCSDELKAAVQPVRKRLRELEAERLGVAATGATDSDVKDMAVSSSLLTRACSLCRLSIRNADR